MKRKTYFLLFLLLCALLTYPCLAATPTEDMARITGRLCESLLTDDAGTLSHIQQAKGFMDTLQADGSWADINYADKNTVAWATAKHLDRVFFMAQAYRHSKSPLCDDKELAKKALLAYDTWFERKLTNPNRWWTDLWQPGMLGNILILLEKDATPDEIATGASAMKVAGLTGRGGSNLLGAATTTLIRGCLEKDPAVVQEAVAAIAQEVNIKDGSLHEPTPAETQVEGIQADHSFFQHGRILYTGGYGTGYISNMSRMIYVVSGTQFAFPKENVALFDGLVLDGAQWMLYRGIFDWSCIGREITRRNITSGHAATMIAVCKTMIQVQGQRQQEYQALLDRLQSQEPDAKQMLVGNRHFWKADLMVHHRRNFYASVKLSSDRTRRNEMTNGEGTHSYYLSDGAMNVKRWGDEYTDIFPVWDWQRIPGITVEYDTSMNDPKSQRWGNYGMMRSYGACHFAGGVTDGQYGMAAMDFLRASFAYEMGQIYAKGMLQAKKAWFFFDEEIVCLGAGITHETETLPVLTSINQCLLKGDVTLTETDGARTVLPRGERVVTNPQWVYHNGVSYLFPEPVSVHVKNDTQHGKWSDIGADPAPETPLDVFSLWIDHGIKVTDQHYSYVVAPGLSPAGLAAYRQKGEVNVLSNTAQLQAVQHQGLKITQAAFYHPGTVTTKSGLTLVVDQPCLLMARENGGSLQISLSNPVNRPLTVNVRINRRYNNQDVPCRWLAVEKVTEVTFTLPEGLQAGSSVTYTLKLVK